MADSVDRNSKPPCPQCPEEPCCAAYNEALAAYFKAASALLATGIASITSSGLGDISARLNQLKLTYDQFNAEVLVAFARAQETECDSACCVFTAEAIRSLGVSLFTAFVSVVANANYSTIGGVEVTLSGFSDNLLINLGSALEQIYSNIGCPTIPPPPPEPCFRHEDNTCYNCYVPQYKLHCPVSYCKPIGKCLKEDSSSSSSSSTSSSSSSSTKSSSSSHHKKQHKKKHQKKHQKKQKPENWLKPKDDSSSSSSDSDSDSSAFERLKKKLENKKPVVLKPVEVKGHKEKKADLYDFESSKKAPLDASFKKSSKKPAKEFYEFSYDDLHW